MKGKEILNELIEKYKALRKVEIERVETKINHQEKDERDKTINPISRGVACQLI